MQIFTKSPPSFAATTARRIHHLFSSRQKAFVTLGSLFLSCIIIYKAFFSLRYNIHVPSTQVLFKLKNNDWNWDGIDGKVFPDHIPKLTIHQSWKSKELPAKFKKWSESWQTTHPHWNYYLWTDEDNRQLVAEHYPWFLETYDLFDKVILKVDSIRYLYMHRYGGIYADLDAESFRPMDVWFELKPNSTPSLMYHDQKVVLAYMGHARRFVHGIPNAFLGATGPGHMFWMFCIHEIMDMYIKYRNGIGSAPGVEVITGPVMLYHAVYDYAEIEPWSADYTFIMLEPHVVYPYDWNNQQGRGHFCSAQSNEFDRDRCAAAFPDAYVINYWSHSWEGQKNTVIERPN